jgi:hypothetical protein
MEDELLPPTGSLVGSKSFIGIRSAPGTCSRMHSWGVRTSMTAISPRSKASATSSTVHVSSVPFSVASVFVFASLLCP